MFDNDDATKVIGVSVAVIGGCVALFGFGTYAYCIGVASGAHTLRAAAEAAGEMEAFEKIVAAVGKIPVK